MPVLQWDDGPVPPPPPRQSVPVHFTNREEWVIFLGDSTRILTHYGKRTIACTGIANGCGGCIAKANQRWYNFSPALLRTKGEQASKGHNVWRPIVYGLTDPARLRFPPPGRIAGSHWRVWRGRVQRDELTTLHVQPLDPPPYIPIEPFPVKPIMAALWFGLAKDRAESSAIAARLPVAVEIPVVRMPAATIPLPPKLTEEERAEAKRVLDEAKRSGRFTGSSPGAPPNGREVIVADRPAAEPVNREEARKALEDYLARRNLGRDPQVPNPFEKYEPLRLEALERQRRGEPPLDGLDAILTGRTLEFVLPNGVPGKAKKGGAA